MKIIKITLCVLVLLITACSKTVNENSDSQTLLQEVLSHPPSPAESRIVGTKIDGLFADIRQADLNYVQQITKIKWGDVYDYKALNKTSNLNNLRKVNQKAKELSEVVFGKRKELYLDLIADLENLANKSLFAKAMLAEVKEKYNAEETGFLEIENGMSSSTYEKHDLIDQKLEMLSQAPGKYELLSNGQIKFAQDSQGKELMNNYVENIKKHNQLTSRQSNLGKYFINNQQSIVSRFHELSSN